jgi:putative flippase GtrA
MSVAAPLLTRARADGLAQRVARCFSVSVVTTAISLATLAVLTARFEMAAWVANVVATALGTLVSYRLNRQWVWHRSDASDPWREIVPFWAMSFAGLLLSTVLVAGADAWAGAAHLDGGLHTVAVLAASVSGYAALWVAEFLVLDRVLFAAKPPAPAARPTNPPRQEASP